MQQHLPFFGLHTLAKLPHCKLSPPHLRWLLAAPACGAIDSNISAADSVTISILMIWLPSPQCNGTLTLFGYTTAFTDNQSAKHFLHANARASRSLSILAPPALAPATPQSSG